MRTSKTMQAIEQIAQKHNLDLAAESAHLRLEQPGGVFMPLVIEKIGKHLVSITHYYEQNGDLCADPDVVFFTAYGEWVAIEITQAFGGYRRVAHLNSTGTQITSIDNRGQNDVADFVRLWARNIKEQQYLEHGVNRALVEAHHDA